MEVRKGYKQTEVGIIPEDWEVVSMGSLGTFSKGMGVRKNEALSGEIPCVRYGEIYTHHNDIIRACNSWISAEVARTSKRLRKGDLLFAGSGETKAEIGKCVAFIGDMEAYVGGDVVVLTPNKGASKFFGYLFNSPIIAQQKASKGQGDAIVHISSSSLSSIVIPLPPIAEQETIAEALSDADALIEAIEQLIAKKRQIKQGAMSELLMGKMRLPGFSGEWEVKRLGELGVFRGGSGFPIIYQGKTEGDYPFYKVSDMNNEGNSTFMIDANNWISESIKKEMGANSFPKHTIIFAKIGAAIFLERKKILTRESCIDNNVMGFILEKDITDFRYIHYLFLNIQLGKLVSATALPSLNGKQIAELAFGIPTLAEQTAIAEILSDMDAEISALEEKLVKARQVKAGMMSVLLTGKIRLV
jgi:type I restriction enzyme S subunit